MTPNDDELDPSYLRNDYLRTKLEISASFMAAMLSNPEIYTWEALEQDKIQEQKMLEESIIVVAHDLAINLMAYCQPEECESQGHSIRSRGHSSQAFEQI
ncbi:MAG: hypothetical protein JOZ78_08665 [Chroococcidiopsidaceae cyanobacterium CP_BM_ER_R8_30]|nr:hypothetical protein [Chroococcidiopsidaceae cyanobacterium CP_BM_ER_R8_30]